ncbi:hypothetical protein DV736_g4925, partial [Chaetothyriales sp. CBS 134916]
MEDLIARHRKEQRELQGRITQKKKNATKKTRKGINDECERLERELKERQQAQINALEPSDLEAKVDDLTLENLVEGIPTSENDTPDAGQARDPEQANGTLSESGLPRPRAKKPNRQKARLLRRAAEQEAQATAAEEEAANLPDLRERETSAMSKEMTRRGLTEIFIKPDGHCLYAACAHGLDPIRVKDSGPFSQPYQNVRFAAAEFIAKHPDDFAAFLEEPIESYIMKIKDTGEWGGHIELQAIARSYDVRISILQADGRVEKFESKQGGDKPDEIWLAYYRHSFGLGEHYNALSQSGKT